MASLRATPFFHSPLLYLIKTFTPRLSRSIFKFEEEAGQLESDYYKYVDGGLGETTLSQLNY